MLKDTEKVIYDLEFKKFAARNEREIVRRRYDMMADAVARINSALLATPKDEKLLAEKSSIEKAVEDTKKHLDAIDATIQGGPPSELLPDGSEGIDNKLKTWNDRKAYIKAFIKSHC